MTWRRLPWARGWFGRGGMGLWWPCRLRRWCRGGGFCGVGGGGAANAFRVDCAGAGGCCGAVLYSICCRICVGAVLSFGCVAVRGVGLRLLLCGCLRLDGFRDGCHGHRRADHGRARDDRVENVGVRVTP